MVEDSAHPKIRSHGTGWDDITKTQEIRNHVRLANVQKLLNMGVPKN